MSRTNLLKSATFRLTLAYLGIFGLSTAALLLFVYAASVTYMERQTAATIEAEVQGLREQFANYGLAALRKTVAERSRAAGDEPQSVYLLVDSGGGRLAGNLDGFSGLMPGDRGWVTFEIKGEKGARSVRAQMLSVPTGKLLPNFGELYLVVGRVVDDKRGTQRLIRNVVVAGGLVMLVLGFFGGLFLSRWTLGRLEAINRTTERIMAGDLSQRVAVPGGGSGDEFDDLARNLNSMLERIDRLVAGMREVTDNIAHDLRTPLTRMRSRIEVGLMSRPDTETSRRLLEETVADADNLIATFNALLNIARAEAGEQRSEWEEVALDAVCADVAELYGPLAEERGSEVLLDAPPGVTVNGNRHMLAQALANLVDNAIKYGPDGGTTRVKARIEGGRPVLEVIDDGPGIPAEMRGKVLERFTRLEADRSQPGNGLGLSLVNAVAKLHGAKLELDGASPGLVVRLTFPPARAAGTADEAEPAESKRAA